MPSSRIPLLLARTAALFVVGTAVFSLGTWTFGNWRMATFGSGCVPVAPITAILFLLVGGVHFLGLLRPGDPCCRIARWIVGIVTAALASVVLLWSGHGGLPWDTWLLSPADIHSPLPVGRMSFLTAGFFLLAAGALITGQSSRATLVRIGAFGASAGLVAGVAAVIGYAAGLPALYAGRSSPMAPLTAVAFIALYGSLLFGRTPVNRREESVFDESLAADATALKRRLIGATLAAATLLAVAGFTFIRSEQTEARKAIRGELGAVANLKAAEISRWREERLAEGRFLNRAPFVAEDIAALAASPDSPALRARVKTWFELIKGGDRYGSAAIFDSRGRLLLSIPEIPANLEHQASHAREVNSGTGPVLTDLHAGAGAGVHMDLVVPIEAAGVRIGTILLELNPAKFLFPMIQTWPAPSLTAETILVRRDGDEILYLNELRHRKDAALRLRRSMQGPQLGAAAALRGDTRVREGVDYRGVPVLSAGRTIEGSSWTILAKVDLAELYAPVRQETLQSGLLFGLLLGGLWFGAAILWRERQAEYLRRTVVLESDRKALAERLALLTRYANDIIIVMDGAGQLLEANDRAVSTYGFTREELRTLAPGAWLPEAERSSLPAVLEALAAPGGTLYETVHQRRDGSTFPVEVSGRAIQTDEGVRLLAIARDISQRKDHERQIDRLTRLYAALSHINQAIVHAPTKEELFRSVSQVLVKSGGFRMVWIGWHHPDTGQIEVVAKAGDDQGYFDVLDVTTDVRAEGQGPTGGAVRENCTQVCNDFSASLRTPRRDRARRAGVRSAISLPIRLDGKAVGSLAVYAPTPDYFGPAEVSLLEEAANDLSFALQSLRRVELHRESELRQKHQMDELRRWHEITLGRETRVLELKREINALLDRLGLPPRYEASQISPEPPECAAGTPAGRQDA